MTVLWLESGDMMKYFLSPLEIPRTQVIFHCIPLLSSQYSYTVRTDARYVKVIKLRRTKIIAQFSFKFSQNEKDFWQIHQEQWREQGCYWFACILTKGHSTHKLTECGDKTHKITLIYGPIHSGPMYIDKYNDILLSISSYLSNQFELYQYDVPFTK